MINYGEAPSNQKQLEIMDGYTLTQEVRQWVEDNPEIWKKYLQVAAIESTYGEMSPNYAIEVLRHRHKVSIRNGYAPVLARLAMEKSDKIRFRIARSKVDGYFDLKL